MKLASGGRKGIRVRNRVKDANFLVRGIGDPKTGLECVIFVSRFNERYVLKGFQRSSSKKVPDSSQQVRKAPKEDFQFGPKKTSTK